MYLRNGLPTHEPTQKKSHYANTNVIVDNIHHCVIKQARLLNLSLIMPFDISIFLTPSQSTCGLSRHLTHPYSLTSARINGHP
jgi:hypothetical protein